MPLTIPAHQAVVLPLKRWRPDTFDGSALCIGAAAPDLGYAFGQWMAATTNSAFGIVVFAVPFTLAVCAVLRWRAAPGVFAQLPDGGPLRLRSYRVLAARRPRLSASVVSAAVGAGSHVVIDSFTHDGWWGSDFFGLERTAATLPIAGTVSVAEALQYVGHVGGTVVALVLFASVGRERLVERWYGEAAVSAARRVEVRPLQRLLFWAVAVVPSLAVGLERVSAGEPALFPVMTAFVLGLLVAGCLPLHRPVGDHAIEPARHGTGPIG